MGLQGLRIDPSEEPLQGVGLDGMMRRDIGHILWPLCLQTDLELGGGRPRQTTSPWYFGLDEDQIRRYIRVQEKLPRVQDQGELNFDSRPLPGAFLRPPALPVVVEQVSLQASCHASPGCEKTLGPG